MRREPGDVTDALGPRLIRQRGSLRIRFSPATIEAMSDVTHILSQIEGGDAQATISGRQHVSRVGGRAQRRRAAHEVSVGENLVKWTAFEDGVAGTEQVLRFIKTPDATRARILTSAESVGFIPNAF